MRKISFIIFLVAVMGIEISDAGAQSLAKRFMIGMTGGAQRLYGDSSTTRLGVGGEGHIGYRLTSRLGATLVGGIATLPYSTIGVLSNRTSIFYGNLLFDFELLNKGRFHPYIMVGGGGYNYKVQNSPRYIDGSGVGGFGVRWLIAHTMALDIHSTYHFTTSDRLDAIIGSGKDNYASARIGFSYFRGGSHQHEPKDLFSEEKSEVVEVDSETWPSDSTAEMANAMPAEMAANDTTTQKEYERLQSRVNELNQDIKSKESQITTLTSAINESQGKVTQMQETLQTPPPAPVRNDGEFSGWYEQALNKYYAKRYAEAITMFRDLSNQFPSHPLRPNCLYWIGEAQYQLRNFQEAVEMWNLVLQAPMSVKKDDALLMLGKSYAQTNRPEEARKALQRLIQEFPTSEYVSKAEAMLNKMQTTAMTQ